MSIVIPYYNKICSKRTTATDFINTSQQTATTLANDVTDNKTKGIEEYMNLRNIPSTPTTNQDPNLIKEDVRLATFIGWNVPFIDKNKLAMFGFYYLGQNDKVKCFFCRVEIGRWVPEDNILTEHTRWSPYCALMNRKPTNNVPINAELLNSLLPAPSFDVCGGGVRIRYSSYAEGPDTQQHSLQPQDRVFEGIDEISPVSSLSSSPMSDDVNSSIIVPKRPEHPEFALETQRIKSFEDWPKTIKQKPAQLSDAGFYYTGKGDRVCCFSCGGGLKDWEENDQPWEQHAMWYNKCEYLKLMKGAEYIASILKRKDEPSTSSQTQSPQNSTPCHSHCGSQDSGFGLHHEDELPSPNLLSESSIGTSTLKTQLSSDDESKKQITDLRLCKICYENEYNTAFFPCGHVVACGKCASSVSKCPCCRQSFTNVMRVYFS
jgi:baculoviral IAP repeat-containing protein 7/8